MWDPVTLLESIGADANLMHADAAQLDATLEGAGLASELRLALVTGNVQTLRELLRAPDIVCCLIDPPEEEEDEEDEGDGVEDEDEDDEDGIDPTRGPKPRGSFL